MAANGVYTIVKAFGRLLPEGYGQKRVHQKPLLQRPENWRLSIIKWSPTKKPSTLKHWKNIDKNIKKENQSTKEENSPSRSSLKKEVT